MLMYKIVRNVCGALFSMSSKVLPKEYVKEYKKDVETVPFDNSKLFVFSTLMDCTDYLDILFLKEDLEIWSCEVTNPTAIEFVVPPAHCSFYWYMLKSSTLKEVGWDGIYFSDGEWLHGMCLPDNTILVDSVVLIERIE